MTMDPGDINSWVQSYGGPQLRTFSKTINVSSNVYTNSSGNSAGTSNYVNSGTSSTSTNHNFNRTGSADNTYNGYYDGGITSGGRIYAQDIVDTMEDIVRRTVDVCEGAYSNRSQSHYVCHTSCHSSCHTSRGRR